MSEFTDWIPILSLLIASISATAAILTYLRVTRKYRSKALHFSRKLGPNENQIMFTIKGSGLLQKIEMAARGSEDAVVIASIDNQIFIKEAFKSLIDRESKYVSEGSFTDVNGMGEFNLEMDLQKNFYNNIEMSVNNKHKTATLEIRGTVHYNIGENRFRLKKTNWFFLCQSET